ncbi:dihydropteroate synthase [Treponema sp. OMZ 840]
MGSVIPPPISLADRVLTARRSAYIMSIVNCTPDSFWELSRTYSSSQAAEQALAHFECGADIIDIGGESSRPGSEYVSADEQIKRIVPVIEQIRRHSDIPLSVDTRLLPVMQAARQAGADILNDISALEDDAELGIWAAKEKIPVILMHKRGTPLIMQNNTYYTDIVSEIALYLSNRIQYAVSQGIRPDKIIADPGIGFGKDVRANTALIQGGYSLAELIYKQSGVKLQHMLMGLSRKSVIGALTGKNTEERLAGSIAANLIAVQHGFNILRVHDTAQTADMLNVLTAFLQTGQT